MVSFQPEDLYAAGDNVADFSKGMASNVANAVCGLYQNYPTGFIKTPVSEGVNGFLRGFWDSFCGRLPEPKLPNPPKFPFRGGQCCGVAYKLVITYVSCGRQGQTGTTCQFGQEPTTTVTETTVLGKIIGFKDGPLFNGVKTTILMTRENCDKTRETVGIFNIGATDILLSYSVVASRVDGQPDTCGDPEPEYPDKEPPPPSNQREYRYPSPGDKPPPVPYTIDFDPDFFVPIINAKLGDFDIDIEFDAGGINFELPDLNFNIGGDGENPPPPPNDDRFDDIDNNFDQLNKKLDRLSKDGDKIADDKGEQEDEIEEEVENLTGLLIQVTEIPEGYGREFGAPELFDFGRVHFKRNNFYSEEYPLTTVLQWIGSPVGVNGYIVRLNPGVKANVVVVKEGAS